MSVGLLKDMLRTRSDECGVKLCHKRVDRLNGYEGESAISSTVDNINRKMCDTCVKIHRLQLQVTLPCRLEVCKMFEYQIEFLDMSCIFYEWIGLVACKEN